MESELKSFLIDAVGGPANADKYKVNQMRVQFHFYDEKDELLYGATPMFMVKGTRRD